MCIRDVREIARIRTGGAIIHEDIRGSRWPGTYGEPPAVALVIAANIQNLDCVEGTYMCLSSS